MLAPLNEGFEGLLKEGGGGGGEELKKVVGWHIIKGKYTYQVLSKDDRIFFYFM